MPTPFGINPNTLAGVGAIGAGLAGAFPTTTETNTNSNSNTNSSGQSNSNFNQFSNQDLITWLSQLMSAYNEQNTSGTSSTTPNLSPESAALLSKLTQSYGSLSKPVDMAGYEAGQDQSINRNSDLARQSAANIMASRGLATSPVAATTDANIDASRFGQINQVHQQIPLLQNQMNLANLGSAASFFNMIPRGSTTTNSGTTSGTSGSSTNTQGQNTSRNVSGGTAYQNQDSATHNTTETKTKTKAGGGVGGVLHGLFG